MKRPFEPTGLSTQDWQDISPSWVSLEGIILVQKKVSIEGLRNALYNGPTYSGDQIPHVVCYEEKLYLSDGYHRYCIAMIKEEELFLARIFHKNCPVGK